MERRVINGPNVSPATAASTLNIVYKEEYIYSDGVNNNNEEDFCENDATSTNGQEFILVTLDDNQSLDTLISNLNQVMRNTEYVVVEAGDSLLKHAVGRAEVEEEEEESSPSELIWAGGSDGESRVISDDEDVVDNAHHHDQIIYVNSEDVVSSEPAEQFIVLESDPADLVDGEIQLISPSVQYTIAAHEADADDQHHHRSRLEPETHASTRQFFQSPHSPRLEEAEAEAEAEAEEFDRVSSSYKSRPASSATRMRKKVKAENTKNPRKNVKRKADELADIPEGEQTHDVQCTLCKAYTFDLKSHLKLHCDVCNVFMKDPELLKAHRLKHDKAAVGHCSCGICGEKFDSSELLRGHLQINGYHRNLNNPPPLVKVAPL